jgi:hypothetical protein
MGTYIRAVWRFLQKTENRTYGPGTPFLSIYLKEYQSTYNRDTRTLMFTVALFTTA